MRFPTRALVAIAALFVPLVAIAPAQAAPAASTGSVRSAVSLTAPASGVYGSTITLSGVLWRYGTQTKIAGSKVTLQRAPLGTTTWTTVASVNTGPGGAYRFAVTHGRQVSYRAIFAGNATYTSALSNVRSPAVTQKLVISGMTSPYNTGTLEVTIGRWPQVTQGPRIYLQRYSTAKKTWVSIATSLSGSTHVTLKANVGASVGTYRVVASAVTINGVGRFGAATTASRTFAHYVWRGIFRKPILASGGEKNPARDIFEDENSPAGTRALLSADVGGSSWVDANTSGCTRLRGFGLNLAVESGEVTLKMTILQPPRVLSDETLPRLEFGKYLDLSLAGGRTRLQMSDVGPTTVSRPNLSVRMEVLCAN